MGMYRCLLDSVMREYASLKITGGCACVDNKAHLAPREILIRLLCHVKTPLTVYPDRSMLIYFLPIVERFGHCRICSSIVIA